MQIPLKAFLIPCLLLSGLFANPKTGFSQESMEPTEPAIPAESSTTSASNSTEKPNPRLEAVRKATFARTATAILEASKTKEIPAASELDDAAIVAQLQRDVALGRWPMLSEHLAAAFPDDKMRDEAFQAILKSLLQAKGDGAEMQNQGRQIPPGFMPSSEIKLSDVVGLMTICPSKEPSDALVTTYVSLLKAASKPAPEMGEFIAALEAGAGPFGGQNPADRLRAAKVLINGGKGKQAGPFLPALTESADNVAVLNLWTRQLEAIYNDKKRSADLEAAWKAAVAAFDAAKTPGKDRDEAISKLVSLADRVREPLGKTWLQEALARQLDISVEILSNAGLQTLKNRVNANPQDRQNNLKLQQRVVEAVLKAAPDRASEWQRELELLALNWRAEAEWSLQRDQSTNSGPEMEFDPFGNVYFSQMQNQLMQQQMDGNAVPTIATADILKFSPSEEWIESLDPSLRPGFYRLLAQLHLKVKELEKAFPLIEKVAATRPDWATQLSEQFLSVWAEKNDPNNEQRRTNRYMFIYGYNPSTQGIPLTRSRQIRNLENLADWVGKIRAMPLENFKEQKILDAFVKCHGLAEVFRLEDVRTVLGPAETLSPETVAAFASTMRNNLAGQWKDEKVQLQAKTGRKEKEIHEQVLQGYQSALEIVSAQLKVHPDNWRLLLERAALLCDENVFLSEDKKDSDFARRREASFADFQAAAAAYAKALPTLEEKDQSADVFVTWFYASMGASDLAKVKAEQVPSPQQIPLIREAITELGGEAIEKHETLFANALATRISAVQPAVKQRYVEMGLPIAGNNDRAKSVRDVAEFYADIVKEITLEVNVDGNPVGTEPFGVWVNIRHTPEVERASGGFQKYLVNQNNQQMFWNFGRPPENYRDKFSEGIKEALSETFDILSVTFHSEKVESQADSQPGWRVTPYAYLYLKSKGPQVDVLPPLKLNLDFTETGGYVILPVSSGRVPLDSSNAPAAGALSNVEITQTLDERKFAEGKVDLEIQASGEGLLPVLDRLVTLDFGDFAVAELVDQDILINELQSVPDASSKVITARNWTVKLQRKPNAGNLFRFPQPLTPEYQVTNYRYEGNDLGEVKSEVNLGTGSHRGSVWMWSAIALVSVLAAAFALIAWRRRLKRIHPEISQTLQIPAPLNALNLLGFLRQIRELPGLNTELQSKLDAEIARIEDSCYAPQPTESVALDLQEVARNWFRRIPV